MQTTPDDNKPEAPKVDLTPGHQNQGQPLAKPEDQLEDLKNAKHPSEPALTEIEHGRHPEEGVHWEQNPEQPNQKIAKPNVAPDPKAST